MSFFDDKEEILAVELTNYGKELLSRGKFNPKYYAFYDDDILYDGEYGKISEEQNDIQDRILKYTPTIKPIHNNQNIENSSRNFELFTGDYYLQKKPILNDKTFLNALGTSDYNIEYAPAWKVSVLSGTIKNYSSGTYENKIYYDKKESKTYKDFVKIPQIDLLTENCYVSLNAVNEEYVETSYVTERETLAYYLEKAVKKSFFIEEKNCENNRHNFSIEVFMQDDANSNWQQLHFYKSQQHIKNNILLDEPLYQETVDYEDKYAVDTYLQIYLDDENIIIGDADLRYNLYTSDITEEDAC